MANKKNKKNNSSSQKKVVNILSKANQAVEIAYENNLERISGAILLGVETKKITSNIHVSFATRASKTTKMA